MKKQAMKRQGKRYYRCPVTDQIREKGIVNEVRAFVASHQQNDPAVLDWINERDQCDQQAELVKFICEEVAYPSSMTLDQMPKAANGQPKTGIVARNLIVRCPIHGEQLLQLFGHHVTVKR